MAERMAALLRYANYADVGRALGVGRATVSKWARGTNVGPYQLEAVRSLLAREIGPHLDIQKEPVPPAWAERVLASLMVRESREGVTDEELARAQARAAAYLAVTVAGRPRPRGGGGRGAAET